MDSIPHRECRTCHQLKPLTPNHFKQKGRWFEHECKACFNERYKLKRRTPQTKPANRVDSEGYKVCPKCNRRLPATKENFHSKGKGIASHCRECRNAANQEYMDAHPEAREIKKAGSREWHKNNQERNRVRQKLWRQNNPHKSRQKSLRYIRKHPEVKRIIQGRREARRANLPDTFTPQDWKHALDYFGGCCAVCGRSEDLWTMIAADHWIPISSPECKGTVPGNIIPLCHAKKGHSGLKQCCNNSKYNKAPMDWLIEQFGQEQAQVIFTRIRLYFNSLSQ